MKFTLNWLKEHLETDAPVASIAETLTMIGLEIESVIDRAKDLAPFTVARVIEAKQHPDADRLRVCRVETAGGEVQVVCGAPNARTGMLGVFAPSGTFIPGTGITLKKSMIRGVESNGMLLSEREMKISDEHDGIVDLPADAKVGAPATAVMGLNDVVFDVSITPNRGDCLGVRGIARDLAAAGLGRLKPLAAPPVKGAFKSPIAVHLDFTADTAAACPYFVGRYIRGVKNVDSPRWLKDRLLAIGLRPISALVDITNLLTVGHARPLHVFDADNIQGDIHVRLARPGETFKALNGRDYTLDAEMTVIADDAHAEALAGIMGGEPSGCTAETVNVMLESALFDPLRTAISGRKLGLTSDARYRFERGIDPAFLVDGAEIATRLILEICGGQASELVIAGSPPPPKAPIALRRGRVATLGGVDVADGDIARILGDLGFGLATTADGWKATVPTWRNDIVCEACLVEEVVRIHGYAKVPAVPLSRDTVLSVPALNVAQRRRALVRRALAARGLVEAVTYSFMPSAQAALFGPQPESLRLVNPISADLDVMRPSILPNLIAARGRNADRGMPDGALFEVGPQYAGDRPEDQAIVAAGVRAGRAVRRSWEAPGRDADTFDAKGDAVAALAALGLPVENLQVTTDAPAWYHPGRSGALRLDPRKPLAFFGDVHPRVLAGMQVKGPLVAFEILLDNLPPPRTRKGAAKPPLQLSAFQPVSRDFAFVLDATVPAEAVVRAARGVDRKLIADVRIFDVFAGGSLGAGRKSIAIAVTLQPTERTLTDAEIDTIAEKVITAVAKATGGALRQ